VRADGRAALDDDAVRVYVFEDERGELGGLHAGPRSSAPGIPDSAARLVCTRPVGLGLELFRVALALDREGREIAHLDALLRDLDLEVLIRFDTLREPAGRAACP